MLKQTEDEKKIMRQMRKEEKKDRRKQDEDEEVGFMFNPQQLRAQRYELLSNFVN